eukprot:Rmarinus@m.10313
MESLLDSFEAYAKSPSSLSPSNTFRSSLSFIYFDLCDLADKPVQSLETAYMIHELRNLIKALAGKGKEIPKIVVSKMIQLKTQIDQTKLQASSSGLFDPAFGLHGMLMSPPLPPLVTSQDGTERFLAEYRLPLAQLLDVSEVKPYLLQPVCVPVSHEHYRHFVSLLRGDEETTKAYFKVSLDKPCLRIASHLEDILTHLYTKLESAYDMHYPLGRCLDDTWHWLFKRRGVRNRVPDYIFELHKVPMLFIGEDKHRGGYHENDPENDPFLRLNSRRVTAEQWTSVFGEDVSYHFGYVALGDGTSLELNIYAIPKNGELDLLASFQLQFLIDRVRLFSFTLRLARLFQTVEAQARNYKSHILKKLDRRSRVEMVVFSGIPYAVKTFEPGVTTREHFQKIKKICNGTVPQLYHIQHVRVRRDGRIVVRTSPVGIRCNFGENPQERACLMILDVVVALRHVHAKGYCHNDVTLSNVVYDTVRHCYVLIDMDDANQGEPLSESQCLDTEGRSKDLFVTHGYNVDVWGLGSLLSSVPGYRRQLQPLWDLGSRLQSECDTLSLDDVVSLVLAFQEEHSLATQRTPPLPPSLSPSPRQQPFV